MAGKLAGRVDEEAAKSMLRNAIRLESYLAAAEMAKADETGVLSNFVIELLKPAAEAFKVIYEWEQKRKK